MRSPFPAILLICLIVFGVAVGVWFLRGGGPTPLLEAAPGATQAILHAPDLPALWGALASSELRLPGMQERVDAVRAILAAVGARAPASDASAEPFESLLRGEAALLLMPGPPTGDAGGLTAAILARAEAGSELPEPHGPIASGPGDQEAQWRFHVYRGLRYASLGVAERPASVWVGGARGIVAATPTQASMREILSTIRGDTPSLAHDPAFRRVRRHLGASQDLLAYVTGDWLRSRISSKANASGRPGDLRAAHLLGLRAVRGAGVGVRVREGLFFERVFVALAAERRGLPGELFGSDPAEIRSARSLPAGFPFYAGFSFTSLEVAYERLPDLLAGAVDADLGEMRDRFSGLEKFLALDPQRDVLSALGTELTVGFGSPSPFPRGAPNRALLNARAAVSMAISNRSAVRRVLDRMDGLARAAGAMRSAGPDSTKITFYDFGILAPLTPSYRLTRRNLIVATSPQLLLPAAGGLEAALTERPEAQRLLNRLPKKTHAFVSAETARLVDWLRLAAEADHGPIEPWARRLREIQGVAGLPATVATGRMSESGFLMEWISPVSPTLLAFIATRISAEDDGPAPSLSGDGAAAGSTEPF